MSRTESPAKAEREIPERDYQDEGCEVSHSCLNCPLPQCRYDDPASFQKLKRMAKDLKVWNAMLAEDLTVNEAASRFSVTTRTILRIMQRCREAETA